MIYHAKSFMKRIIIQETPVVYVAFPNVSEMTVSYDDY